MGLLIKGLMWGKPTGFKEPNLRIPLQEEFWPQNLRYQIQADKWDFEFWNAKNL